MVDWEAREPRHRRITEAQIDCADWVVAAVARRSHGTAAVDKKNSRHRATAPWRLKVERHQALADRHNAFPKCLDFDLFCGQISYKYA